MSPRASTRSHEPASANPAKAQGDADAQGTTATPDIWSAKDIWSANAIQLRFRKKLRGHLERSLRSGRWSANANRLRLLQVACSAKDYRLRIIVRAVTQGKAAIVKGLIDDKLFTVNDLDELALKFKALPTVNDLNELASKFKALPSYLCDTKTVGGALWALPSRKWLLLLACHLGHHEVVKELLDGIFTLEHWRDAMNSAKNAETIKVQTLALSCALLQTVAGHELPDAAFHSCLPLHHHHS